MELTIQVPLSADRVSVFGPAESYLKLIREMLDVTFVARNAGVKLRGEGDSVNHAAQVIGELVSMAQRGRLIRRSDVLELLRKATCQAKGDAGAGTFCGWGKDDMIDVYTPHRRIMPKSAGQRAYIEAIKAHDMVFCTGPAGTGKTYLAVAAAVSMLKRGMTRKLVLVRPAVEAGEKLGFLPGDMQQKVNPYLRPLLDALNDMMPFEQVSRFMHGDLIEVVPLAFMRGRTLNDGVIIMDEAQNATVAQMKMFLTRLGHSGKMIITGDTSQIDLPTGRTSGLIDAVRRLYRVPGIAFTTLDKADIVRHSLVQRIVEAYGEEPPPPPPERSPERPRIGTRGKRQGGASA